MKKLTKLDIIIPGSAFIILLILVVILIIRLNDPTPSSSQLAEASTLGLAVADDFSPCRLLQFNYRSASDDVFDDYLSSCESALTELESYLQRYPSHSSTLAFRSAAEQTIPLVRDALKSYQDARTTSDFTTSPVKPIILIPEVYENPIENNPTDTDGNTSPSNPVTALFKSYEKLKAESLALSPDMPNPTPDQDEADESSLESAPDDDQPTY